MLRKTKAKKRFQLFVCLCIHISAYQGIGFERMWRRVTVNNRVLIILNEIKNFVLLRSLQTFRFLFYLNSFEMLRCYISEFFHFLKMAGQKEGDV